MGRLSQDSVSHFVLSQSLTLGFNSSLIWVPNAQQWSSTHWFQKRVHKRRSSDDVIMTDLQAGVTHRSIQLCRNACGRCIAVPFRLRIQHFLTRPTVDGTVCLEGSPLVQGYSPVFSRDLFPNQQRNLQDKFWVFQIENFVINNHKRESSVVLGWWKYRRYWLFNSPPLTIASV